jgi:hypothetical protein
VSVFPLRPIPKVIDGTMIDGLEKGSDAPG